MSGFKDDKVSIWQWNVNGINAILNKNGLQEFLDSEDPDILCVNEIRTDEEKMKERKVKENIPLRYIQFWNCSQAKKGYAGTALFTKVAPIKVSYGIGIEKHDNNGRSITAEFENFAVVVVYTPNSGNTQEKL
jgi:exodeoxyribonuclease III